MDAEFFRTAAISLAAATVAFVLDAFVILIPLGRGIVSDGLFTTISEYKALEVALVTFFATYWVSSKLISHNFPAVIFSAIGSAILFLGLFCAEARWNIYYPEIEQRIAVEYGTKAEIFTWSFAAVGLGFLVFLIAQLSASISRRKHASSQK